MPYKCYNCEELFSEDSITHIDEGIGSYEYGGARGYHQDLVEVSPCCREPFEFIDEEEIIDERAKEFSGEILDSLCYIVYHVESGNSLNSDSEIYKKAKELVQNVTTVKV